MRDEVIRYALRVIDAECERIDNSHLLVRFNTEEIRRMLVELRSLLAMPEGIEPEDFIIPEHFQPDVAVTEEMTGDTIPLPKRFKRRVVKR